MVVIPSQSEGFYNKKDKLPLKSPVVIPSQSEGFYNGRIKIIPSKAL